MRHPSISISISIAIAVAVAVASLACSGCLGMNTGAGGGGAGGSSSSGSSPSGASTGVDGGAATQAQGAGCGTEPTTGATLCAALSICPKVAIDFDVFPNCGFRVHGQAIDVECACAGALCPVGSPTTCDQLSALLSAQTESQVCQQVNEGRCTATPTADAGPPSGCDRACATECSGNPSCVQLCGC